MLSLPRSRRWLLPALGLLCFVLLYRSVVSAPYPAKTILHFKARRQVQYGSRISQEPINQHTIQAQEASEAHIWPEREHYYDYSSSSKNLSSALLEPLFHCRKRPDPKTNHIRLRNVVRNISQLISPDSTDTKQYFNPTIIALPPWSQHQYLLVSRVVTEGLHQESLICEADTCHSSAGLEHRRMWERECTAEDLSILGAFGGLRCATPPKIISIPPTPAEKCEGTWSSFPNIPGFHDPRIFWSGRGEPLIMVNSASRYACVGLWITDLRTLHDPLKHLLTFRTGQMEHLGPLMSYPSLTELTRNPASTRAAVEKNWLLFFPGPDQAFVHYDLSIPRVKNEQSVGGRSFAKLIGNGFTTPNLTDANETLCLDDGLDSKKRRGHWHQASNALKLILCNRADAERGVCSEEQQGKHVQFAVMHRKFSNEYKLPLRYERFFVVWEGDPPFHVLAVSRFPVLMWNETASGFDGQDSWAGGEASDIPNFELAVEDSRVHVEENHIPPPLPAENPSVMNPPQRVKRITHNSTIHTRLINSTARDEAPANKSWAYFTYTPSIAWAFRSFPSAHRSNHLKHRHRNADSQANDNDDDDDDNNNNSDEGKRQDQEDKIKDHIRTLNALNVGYLDDEVIMGIGVDDVDQVFTIVKAADLLTCLRSCNA